jgi:DNA-cytosine methyltransferase
MATPNARTRAEGRVKASAATGRDLLSLPIVLPVRWSEILLVEDNSARSERRRIAGVAATKDSAQVTVRLHRISSAGCEVLAERAYRAGALKKRAKDGGKATVALDLIDSVRVCQDGTIVVAGPVYGCNPWFLAGLAERGFDFVVEVRPSTLLRRSDGGSGKDPRRLAVELLRGPRWKAFDVDVPGAASPIEYRAALLAEVRLPNDDTGRLLAAQTGGILGIHRGTIFAVASDRRADFRDLLRVVGWARWIRPAMRKQERRLLPPSPPARESRPDASRGINGTPLTVRANITLARQQDKRARREHSQLKFTAAPLRGVLASLAPVLNVAELFAGAGGMGLGFLLAGAVKNRYRLIFSGEVNPIFVETLRSNHDAFKKHDSARVPERVDPVDLRSPAALSAVRRSSRQAGGVHILIGGPPCQGFSNANRNSWHSTNPHNRLIDVFLRHVEALRPPVFVLENVQGILWTPKRASSSGSLSVVEHLARRMAAAGYEVFPKLLDAVWYGVPQYRSRFFVVGLRRDLGYRRDDFGRWGPFPAPTHGPGCSAAYVTVREAIGDLPRIGNGEGAEEHLYEELRASDLRVNPFLKLMRTGASPGIIVDHVTSRHADYVIDRYRRIPQGGNWQDIADTLTNYSAVERTHSNIYRRLKWSEPSITIGHYRKSMLVHPTQHRGLSLREASRLQSFPDWFRFSGGLNGGKTGLVHKQQQLANAVCPLVTKALAEFILRL